MRRSASSRPSTSSVSKMPGDTVVPARATRIGWKTSRGLTSRCSTNSRSTGSMRATVNGSTGASAARTALSAVWPSAPPRVAGAAPGVTEPLLARLGVVGRAVEDEARERPEVRERLHLLLGDRDRRTQVAVPAEVALEALRELVGAQPADVAAVHPAQLLLVEAGRVARDALDPEALHELIGREDRLVVGVAPAEQRQGGAHRLGEVAGLAQVLHRRRTVTLRELLPVGPVEQGQMGEEGRLGAERLVDEELLGRVREVVLAADDVRDLGVGVVDGDREVVENRPVRAGDHGVVEVDVAERRLAADEVVDDGLALVRHAQAHGAVALRLAAEAAVGAVLGLPRLDVGAGRGGAVGAALVEELLQHLLVAVAAAHLRDRALVPVDLEPVQGVEDLLDVLGGRSLGAGISDPQDEGPAGMSRGEPVVQRGPRAADVQRAGRRGSEANPHALGQYPAPPDARGRKARVLIGAHVSPAGGPANAVERGREKGCRAIQFFNQNPRAWRPTIYSDEQVAAYHEARRGSRVDGLLLHAVYLLNAATTDP